MLVAVAVPVSQLLLVLLVEMSVAVDAGVGSESSGASTENGSGSEWRPAEAARMLSLVGWRRRRVVVLLGGCSGFGSPRIAAMRASRERVSGAADTVADAAARELLRWLPLPLAFAIAHAADASEGGNSRRRFGGTSLAGDAAAGL